MRARIVLLVLTVAAGTSLPTAQPAAGRGVSTGSFAFAFDERGVSQLRNPRDPFDATLTARTGRGAGAGAPVLGLTLNYKTAGAAAWTSLSTRGTLQAAADGRGVTYATNAAPLLVNETYATDGTTLDWTIELGARGQAVHVGDVGISIPVQGTNGATPADIFERGFLKHQFVSGAGSFFFYTRASGAPPFLLVTMKPGTKLEYQAGAQVFVHSEKAGGEETRGTWRQPHTGLDLKPGATVTYGFRMQWAASYDEMRQMLYDAGLFDVRVVPGMTVPSDLTARFSLHTKARVQAVTAEFPADTTITTASSPRADTRVYSVQFRRLGENMLTITHDDGRKTFLEFFSTEPMETLIKKRSAFLVNRQQIRDASKWWNGVYAIYDMKARKVRTIDDPDIFLDRMVYALTCDDPGLSKAPFLASKNVTFPDRKEIESLEYYIKNFVWG
ncbi:MAG: hypothetical protein EPO35_12360, partial [Acidobacteria bacterium]